MIFIMALPIPTTIVEDKFESYVSSDASALAAAVKHELSEYDFSEGSEGTSPFHRMYGMKLVTVFNIQEPKSKIYVFSVHDYFSKLEIKGFSRGRDMAGKVLSGIHAQMGSQIWNFTFKESILVNLPNSAIGILFLVFPSLFLGGITLESLIASAFLLNFILPSLTANLKGETQKKWNPYTKIIKEERREKVIEEEDIFNAQVAKAKEEEDWWETGFEKWTTVQGERTEGVTKKRKAKDKKKKEEEEGELAWGNEASDYKWEGVWD